MCVFACVCCFTTVSTLFFLTLYLFCCYCYCYVYCWLRCCVQGQVVRCNSRTSHNNLSRKTTVLRPFFRSQGVREFCSRHSVFFGRRILLFRSFFLLNIIFSLFITRLTPILSTVIEYTTYCTVSSHRHTSHRK